MCSTSMTVLFSYYAYIVYNKFQNEVGIDKSIDTRNNDITAQLGEKIPTLACML